MCIKIIILISTISNGNEVIKIKYYYFQLIDYIQFNHNNI